MKILSFSSFIPEQVCDIVRFTGYEGTRKISHYCSYAADYLSQVLEDSSVDGAVFPRSCDSCRSMPGYLPDETGKFLYSFAVPARQDESAVSYLAGEIRRYQQAVESYYNIRLTDISQRVHAVNIRTRTLKKLYGDIGNISYRAYLEAIHRMLQIPLYQQEVPASLPGKASGDKRIYIIGSFLTNTMLADILENAGLAVVGDNLTESKRLFSGGETKESGDLYENIACSLLGGQLSPTQNNFRRIIERDMEEIQEKGVQGVIFGTQKYCEPYDYLFSVYKRALDACGIPSLRMVLSDAKDMRRMELAAEAFSDML